MVHWIFNKVSKLKTYSAVLEIKSPLKILSVNCLYKPATVMGKPYAWLYKDSDVEQFQNMIVEQAKGTQLAQIAETLDNIHYVDVDFAFLIDKNFAKRDTTNFLKIVEDALMHVTGIDDSKHRRVTALKALSHISDTEYIVCKYNVKYDENK